MKSKILTKLTPAKEVVPIFKASKQFIGDFQTYLKQLHANDHMNNILTQVNKAALEIHNKTIPEVSNAYNDSNKSFTDVSNNLYLTAVSMHTLIPLLDHPNGSTLKNFIKSAVDASAKLSSAVKAMQDKLDKLSLKLNTLVSLLGTEKEDAVKIDAELKNALKSIEQKLQSHPSGSWYDRSYWETVYQQMVLKSTNASGELKKLTHLNQIVLIGTQGKVTNAKNMSNKVGEQSSYWNSFSTYLSSLHDDLSTLKQESKDPNWSLEVSMVKADWEQIMNLH